MSSDSINTLTTYLTHSSWLLRHITYSPVHSSVMNHFQLYCSSCITWSLEQTIQQLIVTHVSESKYNDEDKYIIDHTLIFFLSQQHLTIDIDWVNYEEGKVFHKKKSFTIEMGRWEGEWERLKVPIETGNHFML